MVTLAEGALPGELAVRRAAEESLVGDRTGIRGAIPFLGPAFIAAVAYVDPGNFATNMVGGATYGYALLWVVLAANLVAILVQTLSAKLGIATGLSLPEVCRRRFRKRVTVGLWAQAEVVAMATDLAEFVGAALALNILFGLPLLVGGFITAIAAFGILGLQAAGFRHLEAAIAAFVGVIVVAFGAQVLLAQPSLQGIARGLAVPSLPDTGALLISVGILGATVMPHVIYLHSALTSGRIVGATPWARKRIFRFEALDVVLALGLAGLVNMSMLILAASTFHVRGLDSVGDDLAQVADQLGQIIGVHADVLFGVALLASGLSSSSVGTLAGQVVMEGFLRRRIPLWLRRSITMAPALLILALGIDPSKALVVSQVVLSFGIPFALIPLVAFTANRGLMGILVNRRLTTVVASTIAACIVALNALLLVLTLTG